MSIDNKVIVHKMNLRDNPFIMIKSKSKTIEMRLNDEKRSLIRIGDIIEFKNNVTCEIINVEVEKIYHYANFEDLYKYHDKISIGYKENEIADPNDMLSYYKKENIEKYGVIGIKIKVI